MDVKEKIWNGHFFWFQKDEETLIPQMTESVDEFIGFHVKAKIGFGVETTRPASSFCKYLQFSFWFDWICTQIAYQYKFYMDNFKNDEVPFTYALAKLEDGDTAELFLKAFKKGFHGLVYNYKSQSFDMLMFYDFEFEQYKILIPSNISIFNLMLFQFLHMYFCLHYDLLHGNELSETLWVEAEKAFNIYKKGKSNKDIYNEVKAILHSKDPVKRNICYAFLFRSKNKEKLMRDEITNIFDIWSPNVENQFQQLMLASKKKYRF